MKEINNLKQIIADLERHLKSINKEMVDSNLRFLELQDKVKLKWELRRKFKEEVDEMWEGAYDSSSGNTDNESNDKSSRKKARRKKSQGK